MVSHIAAAHKKLMIQIRHLDNIIVKHPLQVIHRSLVTRFSLLLILYGPQHSYCSKQSSMTLSLKVTMYFHPSLTIGPIGSTYYSWLTIIPHSSHKEAPAKLLLGFKPHSPSDLLHESRLEFTDSLPELHQRLTELASHCEAACDALKCSLDKQAYYYNWGRCQPNLKEGDEVLINPHSLELADVKGKSYKLVQRKISPFKIMEVLSPTTYRLRLPDTYPMHLVVNIQHLTKYHHSLDKTRNILENPRDQLRSLEEYKVEKIVAEKRKGNKTFHLVQWKGYDSENDSRQAAWDL